MQASIIEKLRSELMIPVESERQVVYILVEIRKFIDQSGDEADFSTLDFHCNWAAHHKMDRSPAKRLLTKVDSLFSKLFEKGLDEEANKELPELISLTSFRNQLHLFLKKNDLPTEIRTNDEAWTKFLRHYLGVIEDCPLVCEGEVNTGRYLDKLVLKRLGGEPGTFRMRWELYSKGKKKFDWDLTADQKTLGSKLYEYE